MIMIISIMSIVRECGEIFLKSMTIDECIVKYVVE